MTLLDSLTKSGISINQNMSTQEIIDLLNSLPKTLSLFPDVSNMVNQLSNYLATYNSAKDKLSDAKDYVESMEKGLVKAKDSYDAILNTPSAYLGAGVGTVAVNPLPTLVTFYEGILLAQKLLDNAEKALDKAQNRVDSIDNTIEDYKGKIVQKLLSIKVS